jgi:hypothetical protein
MLTVLKSALSGTTENVHPVPQMLKCVESGTELGRITVEKPITLIDLPSQLNRVERQIPGAGLSPCQIDVAQNKQDGEDPNQRVNFTNLPCRNLHHGE